MDWAPLTEKKVYTKFTNKFAQNTPNPTLLQNYELGAKKIDQLPHLDRQKRA
jgi:hypothetical protein